MWKLSLRFTRFPLLSDEYSSSLTSPPFYPTLHRHNSHQQNQNHKTNPYTKAIESAATQHFTGSNPDEARDLRKATIFSDAILGIIRAPAQSVNGELFLDEDFLRDFNNVTDFSKYSVVKGSSPRRIMPAKLPELSVAEQDDEGKRIDLAKAKI